MREKTAKKLLKKVIEDYDNISEEFSQTRENLVWKDFDEILPYLKDKTRLADLGCGNGRLYKFIQEHNPNVNYIGIDNNENLLKNARNKDKDRFIFGDLTEIPLNMTSVDVAAAIASFHHLPSVKLREKSLNEIRRVLKDDGVLIMTVWNLFREKYKKYVWKGYLRWLCTLGKYDKKDTFIPWSDSGIKRYYYAFKPAELKKLLEKSGFEIIKENMNENILFICKKKK